MNNIKRKLEVYQKTHQLKINRLATILDCALFSLGIFTIYYIGANL